MMNSNFGLMKDQKEEALIIWLITSIYVHMVNKRAVRSRAFSYHSFISRIYWSSAEHSALLLAVFFVSDNKPFFTFDFPLFDVQLYSTLGYSAYCYFPCSIILPSITFNV